MPQSELTADERQLVDAATSVLEADIDAIVRHALIKWAGRLLLAYVTVLLLAVVLLIWISHRQSENRKIAAAAKAQQQQLERATQRVAFESCRHQNEHRKIERHILERSMATTVLSARSLRFPPALLQIALRQDRDFIRDLADVDCAKQAATIPVG